MTSFSKKYVFLYVWLCWVFIAACGLSLVVTSGGYSLGVVCGPLIAVAFLVADTGSRAHRLPLLWLTDLAASEHAVSSQSRYRTHGRPIHIHWTTREVPMTSF